MYHFVNERLYFHGSYNVIQQIMPKWKLELPFFDPSLSGDKEPDRGKTHCVLFTSFGMFEIHFLMIVGARQPAGGPEGRGGRDGAQGVWPV